MYQKAIMNITMFDVEDVITTSVGVVTDGSDVDATPPAPTPPPGDSAVDNGTII